MPPVIGGRNRHHIGTHLEVPFFPSGGDT
jgi:hypothetical protein